MVLSAKSSSDPISSTGLLDDLTDDLGLGRDLDLFREETAAEPIGVELDADGIGAGSSGLGWYGSKTNTCNGNVLFYAISFKFTRL